MSQITCDVIVVGAGIAGASVAAELATDRKVVLLERESQPGYHTTGRSAALFSEIYGSAAIRALSRASRAFLTNPPTGFAQAPLLAPRGSLFIAREDQLSQLEAFAQSPDIAGATQPVFAEQAIRLSPILRADYVAAAVFEPDAADMDVHGLLMGYLRLFRAAGGALHTESEVLGAAASPQGWRIETRQGQFSAPIVVNAAGAWADELACLAGVTAVGVEPRRRTAITIDGPAGLDLSETPMPIDIDEQFYFKPESGRVLLSPADETPSEACDVQPDEWDIAVAVDRLEAATTLQVRRVHAKWAGLRTFAPDKNPVVGFQAQAPGFFWLAGQGGYGIQTAPAMARLAAALIRGQTAPQDIQDEGLALAEIAPDRFA
ncbi:MAG: FAD-dependent oxidoreductase [Caulobacteraceae bacterium]|nr:FAD-dependent oxidoreductase [Caulobacteraceae bacterium]